MRRRSLSYEVLQVRDLCARTFRPHGLDYTYISYLPYVFGIRDTACISIWHLSTSESVY